MPDPGSPIQDIQESHTHTHTHTHTQPTVDISTVTLTYDYGYMKKKIGPKNEWWKKPLLSILRKNWSNPAASSSREAMNPL